MGKNFIRNTPDRVDRSLRLPTRGYRSRIAAPINEARLNTVKDIEEIERYIAVHHAERSLYAEAPIGQSRRIAPPSLAEKCLLLLLAREERAANILGDLTEEYSWIALKCDIRFANLWYWKQVAASAWPFLRKALKLGLLASILEWVRRLM